MIGILNNLSSILIAKFRNRGRFSLRSAARRSAIQNVVNISLDRQINLRAKTFIKVTQKDLTITVRIDMAFHRSGGIMSDDRTICVICAWRQTCNKKFSMDGATTTKCPDYTRDVTLQDSREKSTAKEEREEN